MSGDTRPEKHPHITMKEYRKQFPKEQKEYFDTLKQQGLVLDPVVFVKKPPSIDMDEILRETYERAVEKIDEFYANDGRFLEPGGLGYPPTMIDQFGKDYALNAQGIYYRDSYSSTWVTENRKVWVPSFEGVDWDSLEEMDRRKRARTIVEHNKNNETRHKSEYAWEADAWTDVFGAMRNDPSVEVDKHDYMRNLPNTDPVRCTLTGDSTVVKRTPDATFGLATFSELDVNLDFWSDELRRDRLERLMLHRKCGLLPDPKWGKADLVFPFAVYEAKGWSGDYRDARRQACLAAANYLDMLDDLARRPGPVGSIKPYQTATSHQYQVFALTSFGAHWHLLAGYRRPRGPEPEEYADTEGMSDTVYVFQRIWSARVINERVAWELLSLIDQIHLWAITEFRHFVIEHLRVWHGFCDENYILDWDSVYNVDPEQKRRWTCDSSGALPLPSWVNLLSDKPRQLVQDKAKRSLAKVLMDRKTRKGKRKLTEGWVCTTDDCCYSSDSRHLLDEEFLDHMRSYHHSPENELASMGLCIEKRWVEECLKSVMPSYSAEGSRRPSKRSKVR